MLAENPLLVSAMLVACVVACVFGWLQTGKRRLLIAAAVCALLIPLAFVIADRWVTDRERIIQIIDQTAAAVEANDHDGAVAFMKDSDAKRQALSELPRFVFSMAQVNKIRRVDVDERGIPPFATVEMSVKVDVSEKSGSIQDVRVVRLVTLSLEKIGTTSGDDRDWVITGYSHAPLVGRPANYSTNSSTNTLP